MMFLRNVCVSVCMFTVSNVFLLSSATVSVRSVLSCVLLLL